MIVTTTEDDRRRESPNRSRLTNELVCIEGRLKAIRNTTSSSNVNTSRRHRQQFPAPPDAFSTHRRDRMMRNGDDRHHHRHRSRSPLTSSRRRTPPRQSSSMSTNNRSSSRSRSKTTESAKPPVVSHRHRPSVPAEKVPMLDRKNGEKHASSSSPAGNTKKSTKKVPNVIDDKHSFDLRHKLVPSPTKQRPSSTVVAPSIVVKQSTVVTENGMVSANHDQRRSSATIDSKPRINNNATKVGGSSTSSSIPAASPQRIRLRRPQLLS